MTMPIILLPLGNKLTKFNNIGARLNSINHMTLINTILKYFFGVKLLKLYTTNSNSNSFEQTFPILSCSQIAGPKFHTNVPPFSKSLKYFHIPEQIGHQS